ncbi:ECF RNA polymerase sigma-E factor [Enhygromyxa salina]|uniref:ECF RNA polymerase sigma-E factor n=1 Tax=Enhygromyxa salina TaxID=215803 RepID=A0A2S9XDP3_9BACT|nr:sigma-70 family RNA polymerase sigma factor [Enhygromyxa salina]PRP90973.1 ECF RNA polymerase sigma-E factor [Enhygromyxa salina]
MPGQPTSNPSDPDLLDAWRGGQSLAGEQLVRRHYRAVERFFANKVTLENVPDLAQETFVRCVEARDRIDDAARFRPYLLSIAYRVFCAHLRQAYRLGPSANLDDITLEAVGGASPSSLFVREREQRLLLAGLRAISVNYQVVLELHYWEELTTNEIAAVLDIPAPTARSRLRRARDALEAAMAAMARTPALLDSTLTRLEDWVELCRHQLAGPEGERA